MDQKRTPILEFNRVNKVFRGKGAGEKWALKDLSLTLSAGMVCHAMYHARFPFCISGRVVNLDTKYRYINVLTRCERAVLGVFHVNLSCCEPIYKH